MPGYFHAAPSALGYVDKVQGRFLRAIGMSPVEALKRPAHDLRGIAEIIVGKHRNGPTGTVKLKFWKSFTRFDNLSHREEPTY